MSGSYPVDSNKRSDQKLDLNQFQSNDSSSTSTGIDANDQRPLSPSVVLQQQKLKSKQTFLSPQFDTTCMNSAGNADSSSSKPQPTIEIVTTNEPSVKASGSRPNVESNEAKLNAASTSSTLNSSTRGTPSPAPQIPLNVLKYRNLGKSGLKIPVLGLGVWHNYSAILPEATSESIIKAAFQCGINFFDTGDAFNSGKSEILLGNVIKRNQWNRSEFIVATKLCWNHPVNAPNAKQGATLSRKFLTEALQASLQRLQLEYVDLVIVNRLDGRCPMEEIVRTMHWLVERGLALYWGTCRWSAAHLAEAFSVARQFNCIPPACEQMEYSMGASRKKCETAMNELYHRLGVGVLSWSVSTLESDPGIQMINRKSISDYQLSGILGPPEANQNENDRPASVAELTGSQSAIGLPGEDTSSRTGNVPRTPELSSGDAMASDQRKLSGVSMKLSRKSSQIEKKKMSSVERQLLETANLNVERLNDDRLQVVSDRLQVDRLSVDRLSASSAFSTPDKSPSNSRRRPVDRTLSGTSVITTGSGRASSVCGFEGGKMLTDLDATADRQARFESLCARLGCDQMQFLIAWSLRQEHINSVLISPKSVEQLYLFINSIKFIFQLKPSVLEELERILGSKPDPRKNSSTVLVGTVQVGDNLSSQAAGNAVDASNSSTNVESTNLPATSTIVTTTATTSNIHSAVIATSSSTSATSATTAISNEKHQSSKMV